MPSTVRSGSSRRSTPRSGSSKLAAFREKDREFVRVLLAERLVKKQRLIERLRALDVPESRLDRLAKWVEVTHRELREGEPD